MDDDVVVVLNSMELENADAEFTLAEVKCLRPSIFASRDKHKLI